MSEHTGLEGPEYLSAFADRLHGNGEQIEAKIFHELAKSWAQDRRTIAQLQSEASDAPNIGEAELEQLRTDAAAHRATLSLRERALALIPAADLRETHWVEALCDALVQTRLLLLGDTARRGQLEDAPDLAEIRAAVARLQAEGKELAALGAKLEIEIGPELSEAQEEQILDRAIVAFNALYPATPITHDRALVLVTQTMLAKTALLAELGVVEEAPSDPVRAAA